MRLTPTKRTPTRLQLAIETGVAPHCQRTPLRQRRQLGKVFSVFCVCPLLPCPRCLAGGLSLDQDATTAWVPSGCSPAGTWIMYELAHSFKSLRVRSVYDGQHGVKEYWVAGCTGRDPGTCTGPRTVCENGAEAASCAVDGSTHRYWMLSVTQTQSLAAAQEEHTGADLGLCTEFDETKHHHCPGRATQAIDGKDWVEFHSWAEVSAACRKRQDCVRAPPTPHLRACAPPPAVPRLS